MDLRLLYEKLANNAATKGQLEEKLSNTNSRTKNSKNKREALQAKILDAENEGEILRTKIEEAIESLTVSTSSNHETNEDIISDIPANPPSLPHSQQPGLNSDTFITNDTIQQHTEYNSSLQHSQRTAENVSTITAPVQRPAELNPSLQYQRPADIASTITSPVQRPAEHNPSVQYQRPADNASTITAHIQRPAEYNPSLQNQRPADNASNITAPVQRPAEHNPSVQYQRPADNAFTITAPIQRPAEYNPSLQNQWTADTAHDTATSSHQSAGHVNPAPRFSIPIYPPDPYEPHQDFSEWCNKYLRYTKMSGLTGETALGLLLNRVDSTTGRKLQLVADRLTPKQKSTPELFIPLLQTGIYTEAESRALRGKIIKLQQLKGESVDDFSCRIRAMACKIWGSPLTGSEGDQLCYSVLLGGVRKNSIKAEIIRDSTNSFEEAVQIAVTAETIFHDDDKDEIQRQDDLLASVNAVETGTSDQQHQRNNHNRRSSAPNNRQSYNRRNDRRTYDRTCHLCKQEDHFVRNCPKLQSCLNFLGAGDANGQQ